MPSAAWTYENRVRVESMASMARVAVFVAGAALLTLLVVGCGGSTSETDSGGDTARSPQSADSGGDTTDSPPSSEPTTQGLDWACARLDALIPDTSSEAADLVLYQPGVLRAGMEMIMFGGDSSVEAAFTPAVESLRKLENADTVPSPIEKQLDAAQAVQELDDNCGLMPTG